MIRRIALALLLVFIGGSVAFAQGCDENTQLLLHFDEADGTAGTNILDENCDSSGAHIMTAASNAQTDNGITKFDNTLLLDGSADNLSTPDSPDFDINASATDDWIVDFWGKSSDLTNSGYYITQYEDGLNNWRIEALSGTTYQLIRYSLEVSGSNETRVSTTNQMNDLNFHWFVLVKRDDDYALYTDGSQVGYVDAEEYVANFTAPLYIGGDEIDYAGSVDELRIQHSDYFNITVAATDPGGNWMENDGGNMGTIDVPTQPYSIIGEGGSQVIINFVKRKDGKGYNKVSQNYGWEGIEEQIGG